MQKVLIKLGDLHVRSGHAMQQLADFENHDSVTSSAIIKSGLRQLRVSDG
jgi:hypothetical protein